MKVKKMLHYEKLSINEIACRESQVVETEGQTAPSQADFAQNSIKPHFQQ